MHNEQAELIEAIYAFIALSKEININELITKQANDVLTCVLVSFQAPLIESTINVWLAAQAGQSQDKQSAPKVPSHHTDCHLVEDLLHLTKFVLF